MLGFRFQVCHAGNRICWILIILGAFSISNSFSKILFSSFIGILSVAFDFIMEPVAVKLSYWRWDSDYSAFKLYFVDGFLPAAFSLIYFRINPQSDIFKTILFSTFTFRTYSEFQINKLILLSYFVKIVFLIFIFRYFRN